MEKATYAKIMGLAIDSDGNPAFGYMKLEGLTLPKETVAELLHTTPDMVTMLTKEEYEIEADCEGFEDQEDERDGW